MIKLSDYAHGQNIAGGVVSASPAFQRAFVDASNYREPLFVAPGSYLIDQMLNIPDYLRMYGIPGLTELVHAPGMETGVIFMHTTKDARLWDFDISGGVGREAPTTPEHQKLNNDSYGFFGAEANFGGSGCTVSGITIKEWNSIGATVYGDRLTVERSWCRKIPPPSYKPDSGPTASRDFGGTYGWLTPGVAVSDNLRLIDCGARGTRGPGCFVGGTHGVLSRFDATDCHREYCPCNPYGFTSGGGQVALSHTKALGGADSGQQPMHWTIDSLFVRESAGPAVVGLELNHCWGVDVVAPHIVGVKVGVAIVNSRMIHVSGGTVGATVISGLNIADSTFVNVQTGFEFCNNAISVTGVCDHIDLRGSSYYANASGVVAGARVTNLQQ